MIGGFLGAGKTTAVGQLAKRLADQGLRVGLITNDQGRNLVDTAMLRSQGFATEEIPGGCFCCRFNSLVDAATPTDQAKPPRRFHRRAGRQLHGPGGDRHLSAAAALRRELRRRPGERAGGSDSRLARVRAGEGRQFLGEGALHLQQAD